MSTNMKEYIGARYVPIIGRKDEESVLWDDSKPYEPLTIVLYQGNSYTSRKAVPSGVSIFNEEYWAATGNYNAQIEQYRQDIVRYRELVDDVDEKIDKEIEDRQEADTALQNLLEAEIDGLGAIIPDSSFTSTNTVKDYIDAETSARQSADSDIEDDIHDINAFLPVNFKNKDKMVDYPFHVGIATTTGGNASSSTQWYFRKWDNGMAECWGCRYEEANINQEWGELFENYQVMYEVFPTGLFIDTPLYVNTSWNGVWALIECGGNISASRSQDFKLVRASESEVTGYVMTYAIGRWK